MQFGPWKTNITRLPLRNTWSTCFDAFRVPHLFQHNLKQLGYCFAPPRLSFPPNFYSPRATFLFTTSPTINAKSSSSKSFATTYSSTFSTNVSNDLSSRQILEHQRAVASCQRGPRQSPRHTDFGAITDFQTADGTCTNSGDSMVWLDKEIYPGREAVSSIYF